MSGKRKSGSDNVGPNKRRWLTLENKLDVIKCHEDGASFAKIARDYKINESSVRAIVKKKQQYKDHGIATASDMSKRSAKNRDKDQGVIETFKAYYMRQAFFQAIKVTTGENAISLTDFWKNYNIRTAIGNIDSAWREVTVSNMRKAVWEKLLAHCANDVRGFESQVQKVVENIVLIGKEFGFNNLDNANVCEHIASHSGEELDNETLVEIDQQRAYEKEEEKESNDDPVEIKEFSIDEMNKLFSLYDEASKIIMNGDPNVERSIQVRNSVEKSIRCYRELYATKKKKSV